MSNPIAGLFAGIVAVAVVVIAVVFALACVGALVKSQGYNDMVPDIIENAGLFAYNMLTGQG